jgi:hypothetical protein
MPMKGIKVTPKPLEGTATTRYESTVISPFGQSDWWMVFTPERVVVETVAGEIVQERSNPRAAFAGHTLSTEWDLLHRAYFNGYARWTYLNTPFLLAMPGFEVTEIARDYSCASAWANWPFAWSSAAWNGRGSISKRSCPLVTCDPSL